MATRHSDTSRVKTKPADPVEATDAPQTPSPARVITRKSVRRKVSPSALPAHERHQMIQLRAYFRAEQRGFAPGQELTDWLLAEAEVDELLKLRGPSSSAQ
jgi:Protein of unknown function (DUF2934)